MPTEIPVANLYYLLAYAWNHKLAEAELEEIDASACPDLNNFFARILATSTHHLLRRGLDRSYEAFTEETPRIRGRIDFSASEKQRSRSRGKLICVYDELSPDVLHNRILKTTLRLLLNDKRIDKETKKALRIVFTSFGEVGEMRVSRRHFHRVQLHRNNRAYRFILHLCELIHSSLLPENSSDGTRRFRDFTRDEKLMAKVFEDFIRNFATRHFPVAQVSAMHIPWAATHHAQLPKMITDVTMAWPDRKLILDCKYYREALVSRYDALKFRSGSLYQLNSYLTNKAADPGWENAEGMLLYPTNGYDLDEIFTLHGNHRVRVSTIDLGKPWFEIEVNLKNLLNS